MHGVNSGEGYPPFFLRPSLTFLHEVKRSKYRELTIRYIVKIGQDRLSQVGGAPQPGGLVLGGNTTIAKNHQKRLFTYD